MAITLINQHVANKKIIMNLYVQPRSLKIDHFNKDISDLRIIFLD